MMVTVSCAGPSLVTGVDGRPGSVASLRRATAKLPWSQVMVTRLPSIWKSKVVVESSGVAPRGS